MTTTHSELDVITLNKMNAWSAGKKNLAEIIYNLLKNKVLKIKATYSIKIPFF